MKRYFLILFLAVASSIATFAQNEQVYLVFIFNRCTQMNEKNVASQISTGDNFWIIPYSKCQHPYLPPEVSDLKPLLVANAHFDFLKNPNAYLKANNEPVLPKCSSENEPLAMTLIKNRRVVQTITRSNYTQNHQKEILYIYLVPIIAKCSTHTVEGYNHETIVTIDSEPVIWTEFWEKLTRSPWNEKIHIYFQKFNFSLPFVIKE